MSLKKSLFPLISGLITVIALFQLQPLLAIVALAPLLYVLKDASFKATFQYTAIYGTIFGVLFFSWIPASVGIFSGQWFHGLLVLVAFTLVLNIYFLLIFGMYHFLKRKEQSPIYQALMLASLVVLLDYGKDALFATMPWFDFHFGNAFAGSVYSIQLAELGGVYLLSFIAVFFNVLMASAIEKKFLFKHLLIYLSAFLIVNVGIYSYRSTTNEGEGIKVNLLTENIDPRIKWEEEGNQLVNQLLSLSSSAANQPAALNVWSETVVPWTYLPKDDFVTEILRHAKQSQALTLLGMNTAAGVDEVFDSAYLLDSKGMVLGRSDKHYPLAIIESGLKEWSTHQLRGTTVNAGKQIKAIPTAHGNIGVYICNEASIPGVASALVASGADFLVNISNDGWFANSFIPKQHFYYNRLRAVENRRDVIANSNRGYKGMIAANGDIDDHKPGKTAELTQVKVFKQKAKTLYGLFPWAMLLLSSILIIHYKYRKE